MRHLVRGLHAMSMAAVAALVLLTVTDVVSRSVLDEPVRGTVELTELLVVVVVFLALARTEQRGEHITVDLVYNRLGAGARRAVDIASRLVMVVLLVLLAWRLSIHMLTLRDAGLTTGVLRIPVYPILGVGVVGVAAYALVMAGRLVAAITGSGRSAEAGRPAPQDRS